MNVGTVEAIGIASRIAPLSIVPASMGSPSKSVEKRLIMFSSDKRRSEGARSANSGKLFKIGAVPSFKPWYVIKFG